MAVKVLILVINHYFSILNPVYRTCRARASIVLYTGRISRWQFSYNRRQVTYPDFGSLKGIFFWKNDPEFTFNRKLFCIARVGVGTIVDVVVAPTKTTSDKTDKTKSAKCRRDNVITPSYSLYKPLSVTSIASGMQPHELGLKMKSRT